ncbi:MAG: amidohydrolase family protein [Candidatus Hodarchaeota archaeon]
MNSKTIEKREPNLETLSFKYDGPKFDTHVHIGEFKDIEQFLKFTSKFNRAKSLGIIWEDKKDEISQRFPDQFTFARFFSPRGILNGDDKQAIKDLDEIYSNGYSIIKFWFAPGWRDIVEQRWKIKVNNFRLDDSILEPFFSHMEDLGLAILIHASDPDLWYKLKYNPPSKYGTKEDHLKEMENVIARHPKLKILGAHFAAQPEHLTNLGRWFDRYPNFYVDTSSARWMAREFAKQKESVVKFFKKYSDRILFGTDIVTSRGATNPKYYTDRYLTYQALWETNVTLPLPFPDPENNNQTNVVGLDLPLNILKKIYWENAQNFFKI